MKVKIYEYYHMMNKVTTGTIAEISEDVGLTKARLYQMRKEPKRIQPNGKNVVKHYLVLVDEYDSNDQEFALYKGEDIVADGTLYEISEQTGMEIRDIKWYGYPSVKKRNLSTVLVKLEEDEG